MPKITDTQRVILSTAARREGGAVLPLPKSLRIKSAAITKSLDGLRRKGLLEEKPATPDTDSWRETGDGRLMMLIITEAGLKAIKGKRDGDADKGSASKKRQPTKRRGGTAQNPAASKSKNGQPPPAVRQGTKQALLIDLLKRKKGATIDEAVKATGWQPHSVRGAISGTLKKRLGLTVTSEAIDGRSRTYRIVERG